MKNINFQFEKSVMENVFSFLILVNMIIIVKVRILEELHKNVIDDDKIAIKITLYFKFMYFKYYCYRQGAKTVTQDNCVWRYISYPWCRLSWVHYWQPFELEKNLFKSRKFYNNNPKICYIKLTLGKY